MNKNLMDILACPVCKGELTLEIEVEKDGRVETGSLELSLIHISEPTRPY